MKMFRRLAIVSTFTLLMLSAGCRAQQITPAPVLTAPAVTSIAYGQLNMSTPATVTNYMDLPATGSFCYFVQMIDGTGVSAASNVVCVTTTSTLKHVQLNWIAPANYACQNSPCGYVVSRAATILSPVGTPTLAPATQAAEMIKPALKDPEIQLQISMLR